MTFLEHLIEEVRKNPCLWKKTLDEYRNQNIRDNAWEKISGELKKPVEHLKGQWKKLQHSYRQAMLRRKTKSGDGAKKMKSWKYEELMSFLISDLTPRETYSNVDDGHYSEENVDGLGPMDAESQNWEEEEQVEAELAKETGSQKKRKNFNICKKRSDKEGDVDKIVTYMHDKNKYKKQPGELDLFFGSACEITKRLPRRLQLRVKQEVMKAIINAEMEYLENPAYYAQTSTPILASQISTPSPAYSQASISLPGSRISTPSPAQTPTPLPDYGQNQVQDSTPNMMYEGFLHDTQHSGYFILK